MAYCSLKTDLPYYCRYVVVKIVFGDWCRCFCWWCYWSVWLLWDLLIYCALKPISVAFYTTFRQRISRRGCTPSSETTWWWCRLITGFHTKITNNQNMENFVTFTSLHHPSKLNKVCKKISVYVFCQMIFNKYIFQNLWRTVDMSKHNIYIMFWNTQVYLFNILKTQKIG